MLTRGAHLPKFVFVMAENVGRKRGPKTWAENVGLRQLQIPDSGWEFLPRLDSARTFRELLVNAVRCTGSYESHCVIYISGRICMRTGGWSMPCGGVETSNRSIILEYLPTYLLGTEVCRQ